MEIYKITENSDNSAIATHYNYLEFKEIDFFKKLEDQQRLSLLLEIGIWN